MVYQLLLYNDVSQLQVYIYPLLLEPPSHPHPSPLGHLRALAVYICHCDSLNSSLAPSPPSPLEMQSILYICVSLLALLTKSSVCMVRFCPQAMITCKCKSHALVQEMPTHSSILAQKIPWTEEPDRLQSIGSQKSWTQLSN